MVTKDEERQAVKKIAAIIESVGGASSYIGMTLKSWEAVALSNIDNDFGVCLTEEMERAGEKLAKVAGDVERLETMLDEADEKRGRAQAEACALANEVEILKAQIRDTEDENSQMVEELVKKDEEIQRLENEIVRLKARLYDFMEVAR